MAGYGNSYLNINKRKNTLHNKGICCTAFLNKHHDQLDLSLVQLNFLRKFSRLTFLVCDILYQTMYGEHIKFIGSIYCKTNVVMFIS